MKQTRYIKEIQQRRWVYRILMMIVFMLVSLIFCLVLFPLPKPSEIQSWLADLNEYEEISIDQRKGKKEFNKIKSKIAKMDMSIEQVQNEEEIRGKIIRLKKREINSEGDIYSGYNKDAANILEMYFGVRQELRAYQKNYEQILVDLTEVRSNMPEGGLSKSKYD